VGEPPNVSSSRPKSSSIGRGNPGAVVIMSPQVKAGPIVAGAIIISTWPIGSMPRSAAERPEPEPGDAAVSIIRTGEAGRGVPVPRSAFFVRPVLLDPKTATGSLYQYPERVGVAHVATAWSRCASSASSFTSRFEATNRRKVLRTSTDTRRVENTSLQA